MKYIGFFSEMKCDIDTGSVKASLIPKSKVNYNKDTVINYLQLQKKVASCPREAIDCITGETISPSFSVYSDGEYCWCDFLIYHIKKYDITLQNEFLEKIRVL